MNKHWKITTSLLPILVVAATALTACSSGGNTPASGTPSAGNEGDGQKEGSNVVTVSVVTSNPFLEKAKEKFEAAHPGVRVELKESYETKHQEGTVSAHAFGYEPAAVEKHLATVNAELMNGNASDLIMVDTLNYEKYAEKKLLADLKPFMNEEHGFNENDYYMNVFDALSGGGGLYALTPSVQTQVWFGNKDRIGGMGLDPESWTWGQFGEKLGALAKQGGDPVMMYSQFSYTALERISENLETFMNVKEKKVNFGSEAFADLLKQVKSYYDDGIYREEAPGGAAEGGARGSGGGQYKQAFMNVSIGNARALTFGFLAFRNPEMFLPPSDGKREGNAFTAGMLLAMNEKSKNKDNAWAFLKFLLSDEMQAQPDLGGLPVNKKVAEAQIQALREGENKLSPEETAMALTIMPNLKTYGGMDPKIRDILLEETQLFFNGEQTAEDAGRSIQNKITLYMEE